jgi:hypothetical protein
MTTGRSVAGAAIVGVVIWLVLWFGADVRANWDSLVYHKHALEYAGVPAEEAHALSWDLFVRYGSDEAVVAVTAVYDGPWVNPASERWINLYRMRPAYPLLVAAAYPVLGRRAPMAVSALVTVAFTVVSFAGFGLLFGYQVSGLATLIALLNGFFTHWLIFLTTDGLSIVLWAAGLVSVARYAQTGRMAWLVGVGLVVLLLGLTRPTGSLAPLVPAVCAIFAVILRNPVWRRFTLAALAAAIPALGVLLVMHLLGMPGISDVLQENPTHHFSLPDIQDPVNWLVRQIQWAVPYRLVPTLLSQPILLGAIAAGLGGLVLARSWIVAPFLAAAMIAPMAWLLHPIWSDADRILSPTWVSLNLGIALLITTLLVGQRERFMAAADWISRPVSRSAA